MPKNLFICGFLLMTISSYAQPKGKGWNLVFADSFSDARLSSQNWKKNFPWGIGPDAVAPNRITPDYHKIKDGSLHLKASNDTVWDDVFAWSPEGAFQPYKKQFFYTTSLIYSQRTFQYGYFEIRCKIPAFDNPALAQGIGPTFWLYGENKPSVRWSEIDIFETYHYNIQTRNAHYQGTEEAKHIQSERDSSWWAVLNHNEWHTYACEWTPDHLYFYIDGKLFQEYGEDWVKELIPMHLIAGIALPTANIRRESDPNIQNYYMEFPGEQTHFPYFFEIDHIFVWQKDEY